MPDAVRRNLLIVINREAQAAVKVLNTRIVERAEILEQSSLFCELLERYHVLASQESLKVYEFFLLDYFGQVNVQDVCHMYDIEENIRKFLTLARF